MSRYIGILASHLLIATLTWQVTFTGAVVTETIGDLTFECPDRWVAARGECYLAVETAMTWDDARTSCMNANGSELVQANDVQYAEIVRPNAPTSHPDHLFWIGLNRIYDTDEGEAAWGNIGNYPLWKGLWNNNEPNFEVGDCVAGSYNSFWAVKDCDMKLPFMCQYPACLKGYFRCENGHGCLNPKWQCDGENDCGDNSDEKNCPSRCQFVIITGEKSSDRFQVSGLNNSRECVWTIEAPIGKRIRINLSAVIIEEMADFLQVWTGSSSLSFKTSTLLANMTGNLQPSTFFSSNNFIFIRLVMDDSIIRTAGFNVDWTTNIAELEQSRNLTATTAWQNLTSPFYGQYPSILNLDLEWTITSDSNDVISIEFLEMDIPGSMTVRDGDMFNSPVALSHLTSVPNPSIYISASRTIQIRMKTNIGNGKGFGLRFKKGCNLEISADDGLIQSPGFMQDAGNKQYPNNVSCQWILNAGRAKGRGLTLRFMEFLLNSVADFVQVFINNSETAVHSGMGFTGNQLPGQVNSNEGFIKLKFITNQALTDTGFSAKFSIDCPKVKENVSEFTVWNVTSYSFETAVAVKCVKGYSFRQEEYSTQSQVEMTCLPQGQWDKARIPDCQIQDGCCLMDMRTNTFGGENYTIVPSVNSTRCVDLCLQNVTCGAAAFLITGQCVHYRERTFILTPSNDSTIYIKQCPSFQDGYCLMDMRTNTFGAENYIVVPLVNSTRCVDLCLQNVTCGAAAFLITTGQCVHYRERTFILTPSNDSTIYIKQCPSYQTGKACELVKDWCNLENGTSVCKNGGKCMSLEPLGYSCQCLTGYSGKNCEIVANPCDSNPCKGGSTCRSTIPDYICQCPQGKPYVENSCKNVSASYDIVFDERLSMGTMPEMAYRLEGNEMSVMMWFRFHPVEGKVSANATLLYIIGNRGAIRYRGPSIDGFYVIVTIIGVTVGHDLSNRTLTLPKETSASYLTDGHWHHFAFTISGKNATIVVDGIKTTVIGQFPLDFAFNAQTYIGLMYTGEMSQVTVWNSSLSVDDIIDSFLNISFVPKGTLAQGWWSYVLHPGVSRQYPSKLNQRLCERDSCQPGQVDKTPPQGECNRDPYEITRSSSTDRFVTVEYQKLRSKATFVGYNGTYTRYIDNVTSTLPQDATYLLGQYDAIFVAKDESGNYQDCRFPIYVKYFSNCTLPKTDAGLTKYKYKEKIVDSISMVSCSGTNDGPTAALPKYIPCGVLGVYDSKNPYQNKVLPSCGHKSPNKYQIDIQMKYQFSKLQCSDFYVSSLRTNIMQKFKDITSNDTFPELCVSSNCSNINVFGNCMAGNAVMAIQIYLNIDILLSGTVRYTLTQVTRILLLVERKFVFEHIGQSEWLEDSVVISERKICNPGSLFLNGFCVDCGKGMFYNNQTGLCEFCPIGTYQQLQGKESCLPCNSSQTTSNTGSTATADCIAVCPKGQYYKYSTTALMGSCQKCPRHYYQDEESQSFCKPCPFQKVTADEGANSIGMCQNDCFSGEEPATGSDAPCRKCVRGTYRTRGKDDNCQTCPAGNTTNGNGSTSAADCYIIICPLGQFWDENNRKCVQCEIGYFQDVLLATRCKSCPANYSTRLPQANNITLCEFFCQAGYENVNGICIPCRRGFYKDNSILDARWGPCVICSDKNRITDMEGSTNNSSCVIPRCNAGQYVTANKTCGDCPVDTYQPLNEPNSSISCIPCPDSTGTQSNKSKYQTDCISVCLGGQQFDNATRKCVPCPMGYYKPAKFRFDACLKCRENYTTSGVGQTSNTSCTIRDCPKGTFIHGGDCIPCPYAMYQDLPRQNSCLECGTNLNTSNTGAVSRNDCTIWCGPGQEGSTNCIFCLEDKFKPTAGYGQCTFCDPDKGYTSSANRTVCDVLYCRKGYYKNNTGCVPCAAGTYKLVRGNTECMKCPEGNTSIQGSIDCPILHCVPGKTLDMKIPACVECPKGSWKSEAGNMSCTPCDPSRTTESTGANSSNMCDKALCVAGEQFNNSTGKCDKCPRGFYKAANENIQNLEIIQCVPCPTGKTTVTTGSSSLDDCKLDICQPGLYRPVGNTSCSPCPIGQYQNASDQTYCLNCTVGYITSEPNSISITSCIRNCRTVGGVYYKNGICEPCPVGEYREPDLDLKMPDGCILCGPGKSTAQTGSKSQRDCLSETKDPIRPVIETVSFSFSMTFTSSIRCVSSNRNLIRNQIEIRIYAQMKKKSKGLCKNDCANILVTISASSCGANRRKRETNDVIVDVAVTNVSAVLNETDGIQRTAESVLIQTLQDPGPFRVEEGSLVLNLGTTTDPKITIICHAGQQYNLTLNGCVSCPAGTKGEPAGSCVKCETGTYQNLTGQTKCILCIEPKSFTEQNGSTSMSQCKKVMQGPPELQIGPIAGGVTSGAMVAAVCIILVIIFIRRQNLRNKEEAVRLEGQQFDNATQKCVPSPMGNYTISGNGQISNTSCNISTPLELQESSSDTVEYHELHLYTDNEEEHAYKSYQKEENCIYENTTL